jgi:putative thioredoxin
VTSFNLKSIPYAVAFVDGNAVAQFMGAQPENFLRAFLDRLIPNPAELEHRSAREALSKGQLEIAEDYLKNAIALDPSHAAARLDMAAVLLERGEVDRARLHFDTLNRSAGQQSSYETVRARLQACEVAAGLPPIDSLARRIHIDANDLGARLELAEMLISTQDFGPAMHQLLEIIRRDRTFRNDVARLKMLAIFEMAAGDPDLVTEYRSRLATLLF